VRADLVVVVPSEDQYGAGLDERGEQELVQPFVAPPVDETLGERVLLPLAERDRVPAGACFPRPARDRDAGEVRAPINDVGSFTTIIGLARCSIG
jgi:hypothetical protein